MHSWGGLLARAEVLGQERSQPSTGPFNRRALLSCLMTCCSRPPHWSCHKRRLAICDWMPTSYTSVQPSYPRGHLTCWVSSQRSQHTVSSMRRAMRLDICSTWRPPSGNARCLKSRYPFKLTAQFISSSDDNNIRAMFWEDHRWIAEWLENTTRLYTFIPDIGTHSPGMALPTNSVSYVSALASQMRYWPLLRFCPCCPSLSNPSASPYSHEHNFVVKCEGDSLV